MLKFRKRWTRQPTGVLTPSDGDFGRRILQAVTPRGSIRGPVSAIGQRVAGQGGTAFIGGANQHLRSPTPARSLLGRSSGQPASSRDFSILFLVQNVGAGAWLYDGQSDDGGSNFRVIRNLSGNLEASLGKAPNAFGTVAWPADARVVILSSGRYNSAVAPRVWFDGVGTDGTLSYQDSWSGTPRFQTFFGSTAYPTSNYFSGEGYLAAVFSGLFSDDEAQQLTANPWQLFAPQTIWVPVSAGAPASYTLTAAAASYSLTGNAAVMRASRRLSAAAGSFALTGNAAGLYRGLRLTAAAGSYAWTANSAGLLQGRSLLAAAAAYTLTGNAATLRAARKLSAAAASYTLTGNAASLTYTPVGAYSLAADAGSYLLTGNSTGLRADRRLSASAGIYNLTGSAASLLRGYRLAATAQSYGWTVNDATLSKSGNVLSAASAAYVWLGGTVTLTYSGVPLPTVLGSLTGSMRRVAPIRRNVQSAQRSNGQRATR